MKIAHPLSDRVLFVKSFYQSVKLIKLLPVIKAALQVKDLRLSSHFVSNVR